MTAASFVAACTDGLPGTSTINSPGMLNGMLNGFQYTQGLATYLTAECPLIAQRVLSTGGLDQPFAAGLVTELENPVCEEFMFYTAQLMVPNGQNIELFVGTTPVATYEGRMGLEHVVRRVHGSYSFKQHAFLPAYSIARKVVTQGYAALTNGTHRTVSFRTGIAALDAHRAPGEDLWPREFLQLVPFTTAALTAMGTDPAFLARVPDFFNPCYRHLTNYDYMKKLACTEGSTGTECESVAESLLPPPPEGYCPVPVVVHGNVEFTEDVIPGRSCRIYRPGDVIPPGSSVQGDVIVPTGGCPLIYYAGRTTTQTIYDDRSRNPTTTTDGCDWLGPSTPTNCDFNVITGGYPVPDAYLEYYVYNVEPVSQ